MVYTKPELYVEKFIPSVAVASCDREWNGEVSESWTVQEVDCLRSGSSTTDYIFATGTTGCDYEPSKLVYIDNQADEVGTPLPDDAGESYTLGDIIDNYNVTINNPTRTQTFDILGLGAWFMTWGWSTTSSSGGGGHGPGGSGGSSSTTGGANHYGFVSPDIVKIMTSSF
ncbi:MAG: hypothetical protein ACI4MP_07945 [Candidatus Ventricola sp.]